MPEALAAALQADPDAAHAFAVIGRNGRAAKCGWVKRGGTEAQMQARALQVVQQIKAHEASRLRNRAHTATLSTAISRARADAQKR